MTFVAGGAKGLPPELADIDPLINVLSDSLRCNQIGTVLSNTDAILLCSAIEHCERLASRISIDDIDLPALDDLGGGATQRFAERQLIVSSKRETVPYHEIARTIVAAKVVQHLGTADAGATRAADVR